MAERKLNINAPLMSVRRSSATSPSLTEAKRKILEKRHTLPPSYKSDVSLDQVTEPVAVPFNWERIPGRPKGRSEPPPPPPKQASIAPSPRLPPGKSSINASKQPLEKESKVENKLSSSKKSNSFNVSMVRKDSDKEKKVEKRMSNVKDDDDDEDDVYSDALATLSPTESFSMNCSVSGVSGSENLYAKKSGTFSTDQQARDFMMSRFLPAAKAMTLQPPQYSSRSKSGPIEQPRDVSKLVRKEKKPLLNKHITDVVPYTGQCQEEEEEESEDEGEDHDDNSTNISAKGCGLFPRLRIRNSLCLLNPAPGVKMKNQLAISSAYDVAKPNKTSHIRSFSPAPAVKKAWDAINKNKSRSGAASPENMQEVRRKWTSGSNRFTYSGELQPGRLSPFRRSRAAAAAGVSPCRSKPQSPFLGARLLGDSKEGENNHSGKFKFLTTGQGNIQEVQSQGIKRNSYSGSLAIEKTLYIDTASTVKFSSSNSSSVDNKQRIDTFIANLDKRRGSDSTNKDIKPVKAMEQKAILNSEVLSSMDANSSALSSMLHLRAKDDKAEVLTTDQGINQEPMSLQSINNQQIVLANDSAKGGAESALSPLPPPLPKSPSESWLWRALPLVSVKNSFLHSSQGSISNTKRLESNKTSSNSKWETIVKTSNLHHDHVRYSQELTMRKFQHSKS